MTRRSVLAGLYFSCESVAASSRMLSIQCQTYRLELGVSIGEHGVKPPFIDEPFALCGHATAPMVPMAPRDAMGRHGTPGRAE